MKSNDYIPPPTTQRCPTCNTTLKGGGGGGGELQSVAELHTRRPHASSKAPLSQRLDPLDARRAGLFSPRAEFEQMDLSVLASCQILFHLFIPCSLLSLPKKPPSGHRPA